MVSQLSLGKPYLNVKIVATVKKLQTETKAGYIGGVPQSKNEAING